MEKKYLFCLLSALFSLHSSTAVGNVVSSTLSKPLPPISSCDAPPPDSFRVTSFSYDYVTLAWNPVTPGEDHFLTVFQENLINGWDSLYSILLHNATSYKVASLDHNKKYKMAIRSVCKDGSLGNLSPSLYPPIGVIVELVLFGDPPSNPESIDCHEIPYSITENSWVGFKISRNNGDGGVLSNFFQFVKVDDVPNVEARIKRVQTDNVLVAANLVGKYPIDQIAVKADLIFKVGEIEGSNLHPIGFILMAIHKGVNPSVDICQFIAQTRPWDPMYTFETFVVKAGTTCQGCPPIGGKPKHDNFKFQVKVQSPFSEYLNIYFPESYLEGGVTKITLMDVNGGITYSEAIEVSASQILLPVSYGASGLFFLKVEYNSNVQVLKLFRIN